MKIKLLIPEIPVNISDAVPRIEPWNILGCIVYDLCRRTPTMFKRLFSTVKVRKGSLIALASGDLTIIHRYTRQRREGGKTNALPS